jgi:uncharacterized protein YjaG (DUF416 family)
MYPEEYEELAPDSERFSSIYTPAAIDIANSIANIVEFINHRDLTPVLDISYSSIESIDMLVQYKIGINKDYNEQQIASIIKNKTDEEMSYQKSDLQFILDRSISMINRVSRVRLLNFERDVFVCD